MRRFRFTLIAVCLLLLWLGGSDLLLWWHNPAPESIDIAELERFGPPREWLHITDGVQDLDRAISTSGTIEMEALLVPLLTQIDQQEIHVLVETRNPDLLKIFQDYHFLADTLPEKRKLRETFATTFQGRRDITGMLVSGLIAKGNRQKLLNLAQETGLKVTEKVIFLSEGKEPVKWRGLFFAVVGLIGLIKVALTPRRADGEDQKTS